MFSWFTVLGDLVQLVLTQQSSIVHWFSRSTGAVISTSISQPTKSI